MSHAAAVERIRRWREDPVTMVRELWGAEPDAWQARVLSAFPKNPRLAMKASKGCGKTTILAWLCWNFLLTRPRANIGAISITADQLKTGLWKEMSKWYGRNQALQAAFTITGENVFLNTDRLNHFMAAKSWSQSADKEEQAKALAGFHEDYVMFVLDESGGMPDAVMASAEAALSSCVEGHIVQAGNPTNLEGPLYRAATVDRRKWWVIEITGDPDNPERSPRIGIEWARDQIATYGRDNPWVKVNVFGEFPASSLNALIGPDEMRAAMKRVYREYDIGKAAKVMGVDVARFGDDSSVVCRRQGIQCFNFSKYRNLDSNQGAGVVARHWNEFDAEACFVDGTGGHGAGWVDNLRRLGRSPISVEFAGRPHDPAKFVNKRTEMYFDAVQWIKEGGALPDCPELMAALTSTTYAFKGDKMLIEPKDAVKAKLGYSPDEADAFILSFAEPVTPIATQRARGRFLAEFDPFQRADTLDTFDPFRR